MKPDILHGDCRDTLKTLPENSVHCCVTSPPYWGLRSYLPKGHADKHLEIGSEPTPEAFVETMVQVFREVRRVLHPSGTVWLNLGDSFYGAGWSNHENTGGALKSEGGKQRHLYADCNLKPKDLCMIPWRVAIALQADGWWVRSVICWHKKSCMPESVTDRPTNSWEPIFLLAKSARYFMDMEAVKEPVLTEERERLRPNGEPTYASFGHDSGCGVNPSGRNQRNVWSLGPEPYSEAHFATFPTEIPRRAILAGTSARGVCSKCLAPWERYKYSAGDENMLEVQTAKGGNGVRERQAEEGRPAVLVPSLFGAMEQGAEGASAGTLQDDGESKQGETQGEDCREEASLPADGTRTTSDVGGGKKISADRSGKKGQSQPAAEMVENGKGQAQRQNPVQPQACEIDVRDGNIFGSGLASSAVGAKASVQVLREKVHAEETSNDRPYSTAGIGREARQDEHRGSVPELQFKQVDKASGDCWRPTCSCNASVIPATVLDPFGGSGTTGAVAIELGRKSILCELNPEYLPLIEKRTNITPGLALA